MVYAIEINADNFAPAKIASISSVLNVLIPLILITSSLLLLAGLVRAGFTYMTAGGDLKHLEDVKEQMKWTMVGFILIMVSYLLTKLICFVVQVPCPL